MNTRQKQNLINSIDYFKLIEDENSKKAKIKFLKKQLAGTSSFKLAANDILPAKIFLRIFDKSKRYKK